MPGFFQSDAYANLFVDVAGAEIHRIKYNYEGVSDQLYAVQYTQNIKGLALNPIIISGYNSVCKNDGLMIRTIIRQILMHPFKISNYLEFRNSFNQLPNKHIFEQLGFRIHPCLNYHINTNSKDRVWKKLFNNRKKQILKSYEHGAEIHEARSEKDIIDLYKILRHLYHYKIKKQCPPLKLFKNYYKLSTVDNTAKIFLIKYRNKIIAGNICPIDPFQKIYEWYICGLDHDYKEIHPSILATWAPIKYALENKLPIFDFMGAGKPGIPYGVRTFKKAFGGKMHITNRYIYNFSGIIH